ncbi:MAG: DUF2520 domain-containing protein [Myxococcales bacterium]|nr:DUF2520 domain-containing protein [Myxococcales bacterium]
MTLSHHDDPLPTADAYWLTVPDDAIASVAARLPAGAITLHSAGSLGPEVLGERVGAVLHPLMTFPHPEGSAIPCTIDGAPAAVAVARAVAVALDWTPVGTVADRAAYHAAACLVSGHLVALVEDAARLFSSSTGISHEVARQTIGPLAGASLARGLLAGPEALTGPAARGDAATIRAHRAALPGALLPTYDAGTARIIFLRAGMELHDAGVKSGGYTPIGRERTEPDDAS